MARTKNTASTIEAKALAESNKSEGMRMLFDAGKTVAEVQKIFGAPYGYVYGVAKRYGNTLETAAARRPAKGEGKTSKKAAVLPAKTTKRQANAIAREQKAAPAARRAQSRKAQPVTKPGRPTAARREANRAPRVVAAPAPLSKATKSRIAAAR